MEETAKLEIQCKTCGAEISVEAHHRTARCPYCDSPSVVERPPSAARPAPAYVVGFVVEQEAAQAAVRDWLRRKARFARSGLKQASLEKTSGVYLPAYLYGAVAESSYQADIGENYTEIETYTTTDSKGNTVTRTRTVIKTEWRRLTGEHATYVLDVLVTASKGLPNEELEAIEPFDLRALRRYAPALVSGWMAEEPTLTQDTCFSQAHEEAVEKVGVELGSFMPGDSHRGLSYQTDVRDEMIDLVLLPVWVFAARYDPERPPVRVLVNGQTAEVHGDVPLSWVKILLTVLLVLAGLGLLVLLLAAMGGGL